MWKDLPVTAVLPAVFFTAVFMWWQNLFELTAGALLVFVSSALAFALIRWAMNRRRTSVKHPRS